MEYYYNPEVKLLLVNQSEETEKMVYDLNSTKFEVPKVGPRPPYYGNPSYVQYYPVI